MVNLKPPNSKFFLVDGDGDFQPISHVKDLESSSNW